MNGADLTAIAQAALRWLDANREHFRLPADPADPQHSRDRTLRPLAELAQLSTVIARLSSPGSPVHVRARALFDFAWRETGEGEVLAALARREPHATYPLEMYAAFADAGRRHTGLDAQLRQITRTRAWRSAEQQPSRTLAVLHAEQVLGLPPHCDPAAVRERTWLGGVAEPWSFTAPEGYAVTHTVFHLTDWCTSSAGLPPEIGEYLRLWLPAWLSCTVDAGQWDLTGELLAVASALPRPPDSGEYWAALAAAQAADGSVAETSELAGGPRSFPHCYHATLVTAFSAVLTARLSAAAAPTPEKTSI
ncbi:hypothetical protein SAMN02982929_00456 [Saccharopolyspora kobensis]|uniref:DUF6895 domain-containing protein n=1 Tax=Saccharopolyspora kobensis TaxID=146035 RepID=A0A1H5U9J4_9PSEU|nr:hypothetical protein [Saccharopolyspora kobensis]SEF71700.1 hypothetical protein SAMN02982929_00456 [Saccharopolyspora kobensis]SFC75781.1 hypothetical protein SAMN05216506_1011614 [Saccharopolyspora kobensis]